MKRTDWSSLWNKEDWLAVWIGFFILLLGVIRLLPSPPVIEKWTDISKSLPAGAGIIGTTVGLLVLLLILTAVGVALTGRDVRPYALGFLIVFSLSLLAMWVGKYATFSKWGLETVLWALFLGLIAGNIWRIPEGLKAGIQTEFFIKIGLVLLGAEMLFSTLVKGGVIGVGQALLVVPPVWFVAYWIGRRFGMQRDFSGIMATGVSICGVSAAIAAGGALKGNPKHVSYIISLILLVAMPMLVGMPLLSRAMGLSSAVAGAWMGSTIDTTGAVVAAGTLVDPKVGLQVASLVKMSQNILIGFAAFLMAIWATLTSGSNPEAEKPRVIDIWYRLPKFIIGFILTSLFFSLFIEPALGAKTTGAILGVTKVYREWFFALAFVCIGLDTRFRELLAVGKGKPAMAFLTAQAVNVIWALLVVWLLWSGRVFAAPIK